MITLLLHLLRLLAFLLGGHRQRALENLALRHQISVYKRTTARPKLRPTDRLFWIGLTRAWAGWRQALVIVTPDTVLRWQRRRFRRYWTQLSGGSTGGRPPVNAEIRALVTRMATANPLLYSISPESQVRREDPFLPRKQRAEGRGGEAAKHGGQALADQRTEPPGTPGGSAPDCPGRQENGVEGSRESCPPEGRYKGNLPFLLRGRACEVRRRRTSALLPRSRLGRSDACGLGRR
jgi:hypothetical protein